MKILVLGNCQARGIQYCLQHLLPTATTNWIIDPPRHDSSAVVSEIERADYVFCQPNDLAYLRSLCSVDLAKLVTYPLIWFDGFHPDMTYVWMNEEQPVLTPTGEYSSALAFFAYKNGISSLDACRLFHPEIFEHLGYFSRFSDAQTQLIENFRETDFPLTIADQIFQARGQCPMLTFNHPRLDILFSLCTELLIKVAVKSEYPQARSYLIDHYLKAAVWGVYPDVAARYSLEGGYYFKSSIGQTSSIMTLQDFIDASYSAYAQHSADKLACPALTNPYFEVLSHCDLPRPPSLGKTYFSGSLRPHMQESAETPYDKAKPYQYWRREIRGRHPAEITLTIPRSLTLDHSTKLGTGGSCFAQEITRHFRKLGLNFLDVETTPAGIPSSEALDSGYGVYSARYGNIYTARQLHQLIAQAFQLFKPRPYAWQRRDGLFIDPFRPLVFRNGFESADDVQAERKAHLNAVAELFSKVEVFVFTLGLTETWYGVEDGAAFPLAPGVAGGIYDAAAYKYRNFMPTEVVSDLVSISDLLKSVNQNANIILTVSPVPIIATFEDRSAIISNSYTKGALRAAAEEACSLRDNMHYFPSYELVTGHHLGAHYYDEDARAMQSRKA